MAPLHETVSSVENLAVLWLTVCLTIDQCWNHQGYLFEQARIVVNQSLLVDTMMLIVLVLGKGVRKGEELKAPRYASAAVIRDYITICDIIPNIF